MDVHIDPLAPRPASTSSAPATSAGTSARIAADAGFRIHVVDDREKFANAERFPAPPRRRRRTESPTGCTAPSCPPSAYVVVVTRGHTHDLDAMRALAARDLRYLGLIGSRAKVRAHLRRCSRPKACRPSAWRACTRRSASTSAPSRPAEIAISILAELIAVRRGDDTASLVDEAARRRRLDVAVPIAACSQRHHPHDERCASTSCRAACRCATAGSPRSAPSRRSGPRHRHRRARRLPAARLHPDARPSVPDAVPRLRRRHAAARVAAHARLADGSGAHAGDAARLGAARRRGTAADRHDDGADDGDRARHRRRVRDARRRWGCGPSSASA